MKETRRASPFASKSRQEQLEQWICRQHQQQELPQEQALQPELPPLSVPETPKRQMEQPARTMQAQPQPSHRQYDAIISKMRSARRQAAQDQHWSG